MTLPTDRPIHIRVGGAVGLGYYQGFIPPLTATIAERMPADLRLVFEKYTKPFNRTAPKRYMVRY